MVRSISRVNWSFYLSTRKRLSTRCVVDDGEVRVESGRFYSILYSALQQAPIEMCFKMISTLGVKIVIYRFWNLDFDETWNQIKNLIECSKSVALSLSHRK